ncbi:MAG TPA: folylpolyglutamate synthase/dihydrofolate synthase family protein [Minicystis sp.]|nr:folylpolyglutamate synthase/dihydrofolate synthase family protein [Minicystis sp.]
MSALAGRLAEVQRRAARGMDFGLDRMRAALARLGDPQDARPSVHVAGTNGKGSTSAMIASIARAAGLRAGLYTSPHLCRFAERIRLDGAPIDDARFEAALGAVLDGAGEELTFFETLTAAAFVAFRDAAVDLAVIEVGLGGRLDATNTMRAPCCTAVTSIDFDHTELLGDTRAAIAREKAGILRGGVPVVVGPLADDAMAAIEAVAREVGAGPVTPVARPSALSVGLRGAHQRWNAAVAEEVARAVDAKLGTGLARATPAGLASVTWPGRFETIERGGVTVVLDCAHNPEGARALAAALESEGFSAARTTLVFGALADKAYREMLPILAARAARRIHTEPKGRAPAPLDVLATIAPGEVVPDPLAALNTALARTAPGEAVVVAGSSYLVGELRAALLGIEPDPIIPL